MREVTRRLTLPGASLAVLLLVGCGAGQPESRSSLARPLTPATHPLLDQSRDPRELDLNDLVPASARIHHVWYVPAGRTVPEVVVGWSRRGRHVPSALSDERYSLTLWHPDRLTAWTARWTPHALLRGSPFPFGVTSVRTADVTGDGHLDLLVTFECNGCNHAVAAVSIYADLSRRINKIYGSGFLDGSKGEHVGVRGRVIAETAWGAKRGLVWFDEGGLAGFPYRVQKFLRWRGGHWSVVKRLRVSAAAPFLVKRPVPAP